MVLLAVHALAVGALTGLTWVVQLVVYPSFLLVGPTAAWPAVHAAHSRRVTLAVGPPWAVQGVTVGVLLLDRPAGVPVALLLTAAVLALATVAVTVLAAVPLHERLQPYDEGRARRLLAVSWVRTAAWTGCAVCAAAMLVLADR